MDATTPFSGATYTVPSNINQHFITGCAPNGFYKRLLEVSVSESAKYWANLQKSRSAHGRVKIQFSLLRCQLAQQRRFASRGVQQRVGPQEHCRVR